MTKNKYPRWTWTALLGISSLSLMLLLASRGSARAETVTLPVAVSAVGRGGVPFVSDVRVFNTSYTDVLPVTAIFRFNGQQSSFQLGPREARAFDDIGGGLFASPNSLGAVDFITGGAAGLLTVTSQLRSPAAEGGHVGMFVPGLPSSAAHPVTVLTGLTNGDSRTNIGVYNPNDVAVTATVRLFNDAVLLGTLRFDLAPHATIQDNDVYRLVGFQGLETVDGYATVDSNDPQLALFSYAAEADNASGDLILVVGAEDIPAPPGFIPPTASATPTPPVPTPTPTPTPVPATPSPTPTAPPATIVVNLVATDFRWSFNGGGSTFVMRVGQTYELRISDGDPAGRAAHGFGGIPGLGIAAQPLQAGAPPRIVTFTPAASQIGMFGFACNQPTCGTGHSEMLAAIEITS
jgi:heme/copper-type cytochrome/quinol oxidase subunit 2